MTPRKLLRSSSVLFILFAALHTAGVFMQNESPAAVSVLRAMKEIPFPTMGFLRTYWDFYLGFGLFTTAYLLLAGVWCWQLGDLADGRAARTLLRPLLGVQIAMTVLCVTNFFWGPIVFSIVISLLLAFAFTKIRA